MLTSHKALHSCMPPFCQSESILVQFILWEFFSACSEVNGLKHQFAFPETALSNDVWHSSSFISISAKYISHLTHFSLKQGPQNIVNLTSGGLDKLYYYCNTYLETQQHNKKQLLSINKELYKCFLVLFKLDELIPNKTASHDQVPHKFSMKELRAAKLLSEKLSNSFKKIKTFLLTFLETYRADENVLFFLLRHKKLFEINFGEGILFNFLSKIFPEGLNSLHDLLKQKFEKRGFNYLLPSLRKEISSLDNQKNVEEGSTSM